MTAVPSNHYTLDIARPHRKTVIQEHLEKRSGTRDVDDRLQVQLDKDGRSSIRQNWMKTSGMRHILHWKYVTRHVKTRMLYVS